MGGDSLVFLLFFFSRSPSININITKTPASNLKSTKRLEKENLPGKPGQCNWPDFGQGRRRKEAGQRSQQCSLAHAPRGHCLPAGGSEGIYWSGAGGTSGPGCALPYSPHSPGERPATPRQAKEGEGLGAGV